MGDESDPLDGSYYSVLGLDLTATADDIKSAYHREARTHHPDREGELQKFQCVQEAYETLKNKETKKVYDKKLNSKKSRPVAKRRERTHLVPRSAVRSPIIVTCVGNKKRTLDTHECCFMMPLRHGDVIQTATGVVGTILGMFDGEVYWISSGAEEASSFGHREDLNNPGVGTTRWKVIKNGGRRRPTGGRRQEQQQPPSQTLRGMGRVGRRTIIKKQSSALVDRRKVCNKEKQTREGIESEYLKICNEIHLTFDSERSIMFRRNKSTNGIKPLNMQGIRASYSAAGMPSPRYYRPSTQTFTFPSSSTATTTSPRRKLQRTASATFSQPPQESFQRGASTPRGRRSDASFIKPLISRSSSRTRLIRRGVTLRACTPGIDVRLL